MDSEFLKLTQDALAEVNCFLGSSFVYNGKSYQGVINEAERSTELENGGFLEVYTTTIVVPKKVLPNAPNVGESISISGKRVHVSKVGSDEIAWTINCKSSAN